MTIREATIDDVPQLVEMGRRFRASTQYASIVSENPQQMADTATNLITQDNGVIWVAEDRGGCLVGMLGLVLFCHPMSGELTVGELFWWSDAPAIGMRLFRRGKQWAQSTGATKFQMTQPETEQRLTALYERLGFQRVEVAWQIDLEAVA